MQNVIWLVQHHADIVAWLLSILTVTTTLVTAVHGFVLVLSKVAEWTPSSTDDAFFASLDAKLSKAETALAWLKGWLPTVGLNRANGELLETKRTAARRSSRPPPNSVDTSAIDVVIQERAARAPSEVPTVPDSRSARAQKTPSLPPKR